MAHTVEDIIERFGGPDACARALGVGTEALRKWRQARTVPSKHFAAIRSATGWSLDDMPGFSAAPAPSPASIPMTLPPDSATAALVLADGSVFWGRGFGAHTVSSPSEVCFSTGMTGYQETLTDPSFAGQIITFTFPHIGNVGTNVEDMEARGMAAAGLVVKQDVTEPSNWRSTQTLQSWLRAQGKPGISGIDTRALTLRIRDGGAPSGIIAYPADGAFDVPALVEAARAWNGLEGLDLAKEVTCLQPYSWDETVWAWPGGTGRQSAPRFRVVAVDYGAKRNILRSLASAGCAVTVVPATATADEILAFHPDGVFLSNGPGDPAATASYAVPAIQGVMAAGKPIFGICLGHQLLALALGGRTYKLARGHRGANQPVQEVATGKVEITSQNHGFAVDPASLPEGVAVTHVSLFDGSNEGIACPSQRCFSVQYHPEASPGPADSQHLFRRFVAAMEA
jgi:carbamoyl-phosphate synthase small subunit